MFRVGARVAFLVVMLAGLQSVTPPAPLVRRSIASLEAGLALFGAVPFLFALVRKRILGEGGYTLAEVLGAVAVFTIVVGALADLVSGKGPHLAEGGYLLTLVSHIVDLIRNFMKDAWRIILAIVGRGHG